jgi:hypothetical protein
LRNVFPRLDSLLIDLAFLVMPKISSSLEKAAALEKKKKARSR